MNESLASIEQSIISAEEEIHSFTSQKCAHLLPQLTQVSNRFKQLLQQMIIIAPDYDYKDVPCSGLRSLINFSHNFLTISASSMADAEDISSVITGLEYFNLAFTYTHEEHSKSAESKDICLREVKRMEDNMSKYMKVFLSDKYFACNYPQLKTVLQLFMRLATISLNPYSMKNIVATFMSHRYMLDTFIETSLVIDSNSLSRFIRVGEYSISRLFNRVLFTLQHPLSSLSITRRSIELNVPSSYVISADEDNLYTRLYRRESPTEVPIKFSLLSTPGASSGKIIFYCHGGGFLGPMADSLDDMYLTDLALALPGATIINFEYGLAPEYKFPHQIQQVLDFYLWLQSSSPRVHQLLGVPVTEIIASGDSAGATLVVALTLILNDLRIDLHTSVRMPKNIVGMFGKYHICKTMSPSHFLSIADSLVSFVFLMRMSSFMRFRLYTTRNNNNTKDRKWTLGYMEKSGHSFITDLSFDADPTPYLQPLNYDRFTHPNSRLSTVPIYLMALDSCPLVDESIDLARVWPGRVELHPVSSACHAAMYFTRYHPSATASIMRATIDLHRRALAD